MSPIEWESWNDEITQLYVTEDRSAEETIKALNQRHKLRITSIKQFKKRYSGLKKVRANEWRAVKREMQKQKAAGKECLVFLNGRQLGPDRVGREMRRYSGIRGREMEDGGIPIDIGINTIGQHRLELRTKTSPRSDTLSDTGSSIVRLPSRADVTRVADSCGPNFMNFNPSSAEVYSFGFDCSNISMSTPCFTELLFQKGPQDTLHVQSIPRPRSGRESADGNSEGTTSAMSQRQCLTPEYFIPDFGLSDSTTALKSRSKISARFLRMLNGMALSISQVNHFMKALERDISTFASKVDQVRWPSWWQKLDSDSGSGWIALASGDPSLLLLKPIYFIAENVLRREDKFLEDHDDADAKDCQIALCEDQRLLNLFFSIVLHLICNNIAGVHAIPSFLQWATEMDVLDRLAMYLKMNPRDAGALLEAAVRRLRLALYKDREMPPPDSDGYLWWEQLVDFFDKQGLGVSPELSSLLLHALARISTASIARALLSHGADINFTAPIRFEGEHRLSRQSVPPIGPPLFQAIYFDNPDMAKFLIEEGAEINRCYQANPPKLSCNALSICISKPDPYVADLLVRKGAQIPPSTKVDLRPLQLKLEHKSNDGKYPLLQQWIRHHLPLVDLIIQAASIGKSELSKVLLEHNILQEMALECALRRAIKAQDTLAVQTLLQRGVNPNPPPCQIECSKFLGIDEELVEKAPIRLANITSIRGREITCLLLLAGSHVPDHILIDIFRLSSDHQGMIPIYNDMLPLYSLLVSRISAMPLIGAFALASAVRQKSLILCSRLLDLKAPLNYYGVHKMSCLQQAARRGDLLLTRFLLERGADVNLAAHENGGRTALQSAVECGATSVADCLLNAGADIKAAPAKVKGITVLEAFAKSNQSRFYLRFAARASHTPPQYEKDQVSKLGRFRNWVAMGAPINRPNGENGSLLHYLIYNLHHECLGSALRLGARTEARWQVDKNKYELAHEPSKGTKTPLQLAAYLDEVEAARLLLEYRADINAHPSEEYGRTALQAATCNFREQCGRAMLQLLLSFNPDINALPARQGGITALQGAAISGDLGIAKMLLERGADINAPAAAENGRTAIEGAAEHGRLDMVEFLLENGAKGDPETGFSRAIELAKAETHLGVAKVLQEHDEISALLDMGLAYGASTDLAATLPSPGMIFDL
ncbi:hypothetical protein CFIO01_07691 [Colletotrichum fioriniae PJ7]|uniref:Clr5 domain-containing protein n=1 Tax=Colletotrichum fioriniae PJ7 TaxID=1445577 RepID=A0A010S9P9_9PEZI|nr:hypothetical protein CFIO01_07691 [Colletotrichum fioriniae PJ7]